MTEEEKSKAYDEALSRAKECYVDGLSLHQPAKDVIEHIFPEIVESEDEKVRKALIELVKCQERSGYTLLNNISTSSMLDWLDKQKPIDDTTIIKGVRRDVALSIMHYLDDNTEGMCLSNMECRDLENAVADSDWSKVYRYMTKKLEKQDKGEVSDGYHTFNELYYYRMLYNAAFFNMLPKEWVHKSKKHHDGEECFGGGWFIVMANLPTGQISNHYELKDWDLFQIPEKEVADKWDGHTPQDAADRLYKYLLENQDYSTKWKKNTTDNKPTLNHSVLMKSIYGIAEGEWNGKEWIQYRWSSKIKDSDVLYWMNLSEVENQGEKKSVISEDALREGITQFGITQYQIDNWLKKYIDIKE